MHWGETKTWYGIPGGDAEKFEAAIKKEAPDWFEAQPDLLFQLVTLMNPQRLTDAGVRVYACSPSRLATPWTGLRSEVQGTPQAPCLFARRIARLSNHIRRHRRFFHQYFQAHNLTVFYPFQMAVTLLTQFADSPHNFIAHIEQYVYQNLKQHSLKVSLQIRCVN